MATQTVTDMKEDARILNVKIPRGTDLDERIEDWCGENDASGSEFLRRAIEAYLTASGRPAAKVESTTTTA